MLEIPLEATPNQSFLITLDDQDCTIALYQRGRRLYLDLTVSGRIVRQGAICEPGVGIPHGGTDAFRGRLYLVDLRSQPGQQAAPQWQGLGDRWRLYWLSPDEVQQVNAEEAARYGG